MRSTTSPRSLINLAMHQIKSSILTAEQLRLILKGKR